MDLDVGVLSDDEVRDAITTWAGRVAAGEARLLHLIGELDAREAWALHGVLSCAHWVAWRLGVTPSTAQERVRGARALRGLPLVGAAFAEGRLSYAQVRALTRVATVEDEAGWLDLARVCTAEQLEKVQRGVARARRNERRRTEPEAAAFEDRARWRWDEDGSLLLSVRIAPEHAAAVLAVLEQAQGEEQVERDARLAELAGELVAEAVTPTTEPCGELLSAEGPEPYVFEEPPYPVLVPRGFGQPPSAAEQQALDAYWDELHRRQAKERAWRDHQERLVAEAAARELPVAQATLADALVRALIRPSERKVNLRLLVDPLSGWARTAADELLPPSTLRRIELAAGTPSDAGRGRHAVSPALRGLLGQVDGQRCRFPGCGRSRTLHAHHVIWWSRGGRTDLANLILVCSRHHTLIHQDGYRLVLHPDRRLEVHAADGTLLPHRLPRPRAAADDLDQQRTITPDTLPTGWTGERLDLGYVVDVMLAHAA